MENDPETMAEVMVKCEIVEISDEEITEIKPTEGTPKKKVKKKLDPSKYLKCEKCEKSFPSRAHLTIHMYTHTGERRFICSECGKAYKQSAHLKTHENRHRASELGKSALKSFTCLTCGSGFTQKSSLRIHEKIHTGDKQYQCHVCQKSFVQKYNLVYHIKTHTGDRQFECEICSKRFMTRYKLNVHYKRHAENKRRGRKKTVLSMADSGEDSADTTGALWGSLADDDDDDDDEPVLSQKSCID